MQQCNGINLCVDILHYWCNVIMRCVDILNGVQLMLYTSDSSWRSTSCYKPMCSNNWPFTLGVAWACLLTMCWTQTVNKLGQWHGQKTFISRGRYAWGASEQHTRAWGNPNRRSTLNDNVVFSSCRVVLWQVLAWFSKIDFHLYFCPIATSLNLLPGKAWPPWLVGRPMRPKHVYTMWRNQ